MIWVILSGTLTWQKILARLCDKEHDSRNMLSHTDGIGKAAKGSTAGPTYILRCGIHLGT